MQPAKSTFTEPDEVHLKKAERRGRIRPVAKVNEFIYNLYRYKMPRANRPCIRPENKVFLHSPFSNTKWDASLYSYYLCCKTPKGGIEPGPAYNNLPAVLSAQPWLQLFPWEA